MDGEPRRARDSGRGGCPARPQMTRPALGRLLPVISSNSVVLPEPFGPMTPTTAGSGTTKSARRRNVGGAIEEPARVDLAQVLDREQRRGLMAQIPRSRRRRAASRLSSAAGPSWTTVPLVEHIDAIRDRERERRRSARPAAPRRPRAGAGGSSPARRRRSSAPVPGSARRTAPVRGRRAARGRSPPSAFRRRKGSRTRAGAGSRAPRRSRRPPSGSTRGTRVRFTAIDRLRSTVRVGNTRRSSGTQQIPARAISCVGQWVILDRRSRYDRAGPG